MSCDWSTWLNSFNTSTFSGLSILKVTFHPLTLDMCTADVCILYFKHDPKSDGEVMPFTGLRITEIAIYQSPSNWKYNDIMKHI
jgi:hypothetical protein